MSRRAIRATKKPLSRRNAARYAACTSLEPRYRAKARYTMAAATTSIYSYYLNSSIYTDSDLQIQDHHNILTAGNIIAST